MHIGNNQNAGTGTTNDLPYFKHAKQRGRTNNFLHNRINRHFQVNIIKLTLQFIIYAGELTF